MDTIFIELTEYDDTIVEVDYIFREAEPRVYYNSDMSGDDGQDAHTSIFSVRIDDVCILNVMSNKAIEDLEERITKTLEK